MFQTIRKVVLLIFIFCVSNSTTSAYDYTQYHLAIIHIEDEIFVKGKMHDGLNDYINLFKKYDFVFLYDCITAMQIALYDNDEITFLAIINKAFQNGLVPRHLEVNRMNYIRNHPLYIKNKDKILRMYEVDRAHYLKRIDTSTLRKMICLYAYDQLSKNSHLGESNSNYVLRYEPLITHTLSEVKKIVEKVGFPSDKLIGLDQDDIMRELHLDGYDAIDYYSRNKDDKRFYASKSQFSFDEHCFSSTLYISIVMHYANCLGNQNNKRRYLIYSDDFFMKQIRAGNVHPRDIAFLYDQGFIGSIPKPDTIKGEKFFNVGLNVEYLINQPGSISHKELDCLRTIFFIGPIETDLAKYRFMHEHKMFIGSGFSGCRS